MKILSGAYQLDQGRIRLNDQHLRLNSPGTLRQTGFTVSIRRSMLPWYRS